MTPGGVACGLAVPPALLDDYGDIDRLLPLAQALHETYPFRAVVSLSDLGPLPAARINELVEITHRVDMERFALGTRFGMVEPLTWNEDKVGHAVARGATATVAFVHSRRLAAAIHVRTEPIV